MHSVYISSFCGLCPQVPTGALPRYSYKAMYFHHRPSSRFFHHYPLSLSVSLFWKAIECISAYSKIQLVKDSLCAGFEEAGMLWCPVGLHEQRLSGLYRHIRTVDERLQKATVFWASGKDLRPCWAGKSDARIYWISHFAELIFTRITGISS